MPEHIFDLNSETMAMEKNPEGIISKDDLFSTENVFIEKPLSLDSEITPLNGKHAPDDEDEDEGDEDDLILGDEEADGDEEEYDVELEEDVPEDISENDLVLDPDDDIDEDEEDDDL